MSLPQYQVEDIVYLRESALVGSIESYRISEVRQDPSGDWFYKISVNPRLPIGTATIGDRITLDQSYDFELAEDALIDYCGALALAITAATSNLTNLNALYEAHCEETGTGTGTG